MLILVIIMDSFSFYLWYMSNISGFAAKIIHWLLCNVVSFCLTTFLAVHLQIEEITRKLRTGDLGIPANPEQRFAWFQEGLNSKRCSSINGADLAFCLNFISYVVRKSKSFNILFLTCIIKWQSLLFSISYFDIE